MQPFNLRVNDIINPVGTPGTPYFGWHSRHPEPDQLQTQYQLLVASTPANLDADRGDVWDSGPVTSRRQNHVAYAGDTPLHSGARYFWKVRLWDKAGRVGPYSAAAAFGVGLLTNEDWAGAKWIKRDSNETDDYTYYRKTAILPVKRVRRATVYVSSVHKYELYLNGNLIGKGPSYHYPQYQYYNAYDVTPYLIELTPSRKKGGKFRVGGAFANPPTLNLPVSSTPAGFVVFAVLNHWFGGGQGRPASERGLLLKAMIEFGDGDLVVIGTDKSWKQRRAECWVAGQPSRNDEGVGYIEKIDAAKLIPNWYTPAYDDSTWEPATEIGPQPTPPWTGNLYPDLTRIVERRIAPIAITQPGDGTYVVDLGKVYAGRPQIAFSEIVLKRSPTASTRMRASSEFEDTFSTGNNGALISMQGGYALAENGRVNPAHNQNTDMSYFAIANGDEFTFLPQEYLGLRYFQVDHAPAPITAGNFVFLERHLALDDSRSTFVSDNETLNRVWDFMKRSLSLGAQEAFIDTPTREKGGFLVDSANESLAAMAAFGERALTRKVLNEFLQSMDQYWASDSDRGRMNAVYPNGDGARDIPDFTQAYLPWLWDYYLQTGDKQFLLDNYPKLKSIADYVNRHRNDATGLIHNLTGGGSGAYQYGIVDWPPAMRYGYDMATEARTVINALAYAGYDIISQIAAELGHTADRDHYRALAEDLKAAINTYLLNEQNVYMDGLSSPHWPIQPSSVVGRPSSSYSPSMHVSQQANMLPLALGIAPPEKRPSIVNKVKELKMSVGMVTVGWLIRALGEMGEGEQLLALYTRPDWAGWANCLWKGATSTWESWDADSGGNLSQSHPWGAVGLCGIQQYILGVKPLMPQYEQAQIKPLTFGAQLIRASGKVPTERGEIVVSWERDASRFRLALTLPTNVQAKVCLPRGSNVGLTIKVDGVEFIGRVEGDYVAVEGVGSGKHTFEC